MATKHLSKEKRQEQIIQAALDCFLEKGYVNTTIDDIAQKCDLSKGSIYWQFKSKDDILIQSIKVFTSVFEQELQTIIKKNMASFDKLSIGIQSFVEFQEQNKGLFNLFVEFWAQSKNRDEVKQYWTNLLMIFRMSIIAIIQNGIDKKEFRNIDIEHFSWALMATLDGLGAYGVLVDSLDLRKIIDVYISTLLIGLKP